MKKLGFLVMPLMAVSLLASCNNGGNTPEPLETFTITLKNDGDPDKKIENIKAGSIVEEVPNPTTPKPHSTFIGWCTDTQSKYPFDFSKIKIYQDYTLYSGWRDGPTPTDKHIVDFNGAGCSATLDGKEFTTDLFDEDSEVVLTISPLTDHYVLDEDITIYVDGVITTTGYTYEPISGTDDYELTLTVSGKTEIYGGTTEYCLVNFDCEPTTIDAKWVEKGTVLNEPSHPELLDYYFIGWYEDETYLKQYDFTKKVFEDMTIYVHYVYNSKKQPLTFTCIDDGEDNKANINLFSYLIFTETPTEKNLLYKIVRKDEPVPEVWSPIASGDKDGDFTINKEGHLFQILPDGVTLQQGDKIILAGNNPDGFSFMTEEDGSLYLSFTSGPDTNTEDMFNVSGNIMSLLSVDSYDTLNTIPSNSCFNYLFDASFWSGADNYTCNIVSAEGLILPATDLNDYCYYGMLQNNPYLIKAPIKLPATTLTKGCYGCMFFNCRALNTYPDLSSVISLGEDCYYEMFYYCESLTQVPDLPITTLAEGCYECMFEGCTSLEVAPELPADTLVNDCYHSMFDYCIKLRYLKVGFGSGADSDAWPTAENCTSYWLLNAGTDPTVVDPTFYWEGKEGEPTSWSRDGNHVPTGWTIK